MKTNTPKNTGGRKAVGLSGNNPSTSSSTGRIKPAGAWRGRGKSKTFGEDDFADINRLGWNEENDISASWTGSTARRKNYNDDEDSDSYEGNGYTRGGSDAFNDELSNDPYESFRRG